MKIYKQEIIDHYKNPRRFGEISGKTCEAMESNASCGDMIEVYLEIKQGRIVDAGFKGVGCALSTAAASKLMEEVVGKRAEEVEKWGEKKLVKLMGEVNVGRKRCVELPLVAIKGAINSNNKKKK